MIDYIIIAIIVAIVGGAAYYIYRAKKSGQKCIGCPYANACGGKCCETREEPVSKKDE